MHAAMVELFEQLVVVDGAGQSTVVRNEPAYAGRSSCEWHGASERRGRSARRQPTHLCHERSQSLLTMNQRLLACMDGTARAAV